MGEREKDDPLEFLAGMSSPIETARRRFEEVMQYGTDEQKEAMLVAVALAAGKAGVV